MKKSILTTLSLFLLLTSCGSDGPKNEATPPTQKSEVTTVKQEAAQKEVLQKIDSSPSKVIAGKWIGEMSDKQLTIVIDPINGNEITGFNMLGKNKRPLTGTFSEADWDQPCSKAYEVVLNEPGDDKWDGVFTIQFVGYEDTDEGDDLDCKGNLKGVEAMGEWVMNGKETGKSFSLTKVGDNQ